MNREQATIEALKKSENQEDFETASKIESSEELRQQMMDESEKATNQFKNECENDIAQTEARAEKDGIAVDPEDKKSLEGLGAEAEIAKKELVDEINGSDIANKDNSELENKYGDFIKNKREFYYEFDSKNALREMQRDKDYAAQKLESLKNNVETYKAEVEKLRSDIDDLKSNIVKRVLKYREIKGLEKEFERNKSVLGYFERQMDGKKELVEAYDYLISEETNLSALMDEAYKENEKWNEEKRAEFMEEETKRDVKSLIKEHKTFFVHDIVAADWKPSANNQAIDTGKLDFNDQLNIVMGLEPTISASTLSPDSQNRTFGNGAWGVLLSGGRVFGGHYDDAASVTVNRNFRNISQQYRSIDSINKAIERPYSGKKTDKGYNELVIEKPEVAGIYFKYDNRLPQLKENVTISLDGRFDGLRLTEEWWEQLENSMKTGAPIFVIDNHNNVRMAYDINIKARTMMVTPEYDPENIADMPGIYKQHLGQEEKRKAAMRVFNKATGLLTEEEKEKYKPDGTEKDARGLYNVH